MKLPVLLIFWSPSNAYKFEKVYMHFRSNLEELNRIKVAVFRDLVWKKL